MSNHPVTLFNHTRYRTNLTGGWIAVVTFSPQGVKSLRLDIVVRSFGFVLARFKCVCYTGSNFQIIRHIWGRAMYILARAHRPSYGSPAPGLGTRPVYPGQPESEYMGLSPAMSEKARGPTRPVTIVSVPQSRTGTRAERQCGNEPNQATRLLSVRRYLLSQPPSAPTRYRNGRRTKLVLQIQEGYQAPPERGKTRI